MDTCNPRGVTSALQTFRVARRYLIEEGEVQFPAVGSNTDPAVNSDPKTALVFPIVRYIDYASRGPFFVNTSIILY
ncbi:hypothetical protein EVAR_92268_1 [Eumeta japonica]|uniref:Uncharacterized protein n=1 Tax=Eumeta variegata TaxID=151549 RepID=A0A4C1TL97_EUMVA|nr:hypothetical protein EVAR_92268_1 [Eumeta japonica]